MGVPGPPRIIWSATKSNTFVFRSIKLESLATRSSDIIIPDKFVLLGPLAPGLLSAALAGCC
jgi:hypothetical protein